MSRPFPPGMLARVSHTPMADQAYDAIRASIVEGRFKPGDQLIEARLAEELGISRGPVREGLSRLLQEGLVVHRPHQGMFVRELTALNVAYMFDARVALETVAVRLLAKRKEEPVALEALLEQMKVAGGEGRIRDMFALGIEFHRMVCTLSQNPFVLEFFEGISAQLQLVLHREATELLKHWDPADYIESHAALVRAIRSGDEHKAASTLDRHANNGFERVLALFAEDARQLEELEGAVLCLDPSMYSRELAPTRDSEPGESA